jgi:hypothetical protein
VFPSTRDPLPPVLRWALLALGLQVMITASFATVGFISLLAGVGAALTIVAVLAFGMRARSWSDDRPRSRAAQAVSVGICLVAALDVYLSARLLFDADRTLAAAGPSSSRWWWPPSYRPSFSPARIGITRRLCASRRASGHSGYVPLIVDPCFRLCGKVEGGF